MDMAWTFKGIITIDKKLNLHIFSNKLFYLQIILRKSRFQQGCYFCGLFAFRNSFHIFILGSIWISIDINHLLYQEHLMSLLCYQWQFYVRTLSDNSFSSQFFSLLVTFRAASTGSRTIAASSFVSVALHPQRSPQFTSKNIYSNWSGSIAVYSFFNNIIS